MSNIYAPRYSHQDEQEFSESDCPSDGQLMLQQGLALTPDFTELYRRKQQQQAIIAGQRTSAGGYCQAHMQGYYEPHNRLVATCPCNLPPDPRYCCYKGAAPPPPETVFRSSPHLVHAVGGVNVQEVGTQKGSSATQKKYPVTARTPRYYRYPVAALPKRPSTLCLPVTCQPDPAVSCHKPPRKASADAHLHYHQQRGTGQEGMTINDCALIKNKSHRSPPEVRQVDSEGDLNSRLNDLENLLTKFDENDTDVINNNYDDEQDNENEEPEIANVNELSRILKPKIPASVKAKQEKIFKLKATKTNNKDSEEQSIDGLIKKLSKDSIPNKKNSDRDQDDPLKITDEVLNRHQKQCFNLDQKPLDDNSALELHKSKSYIVSLIDKALSKELGTVPGDKCSRKEFLTMSPKKAIDLVNRHTSHSRSSNKVTSLQVASTSTQRKSSENCECKTEEPLYLKQLKQLRWSHLRHIQREAKRLADLERFLDSFGEAENQNN